MARAPNAISQSRLRGSAPLTFVTIGTAFQPFRRLLDGVDALIAGGNLSGDPVIMQIGHDKTFASHRARTVPFMGMEEFERCMKEADIIICHGGCTVFQALRAGKIPVVMPREKKYGEHINNHQVQFVRALAAENRVIAVYHPAELAAAVEEARRRRREPVRQEPSQMPELVGRAIRDLIA